VFILRGNTIKGIYSAFLLTILVLVFITPGISQHVSAQMPPRERTLIVAHSARFADPENWNILLPTAVSRSASGMHQLIYEYFFYINMETGELIPWLATGFEYSQDYRTLTVHLRKGVKWSDGVPFTADDVVFTYNMLLQYGARMVWGDIVQQHVESVRKVDDYTVEFKLKSPNPRFHLIREAFPTVRVWGAITIVPKHVFEKVDPLTFKNYPPIGTGPYKLVRAEPTMTVFERRDDWWATEVFGIRPAPQYVVYANFGPEDVIALKFSRNEIDMVFIGLLSLGTFTQILRTNPSVTAWYSVPPYAWPDPCPRLLMIQNAKYPFNISEVRWAISLMINRDEIIRLAYEGTTRPARLPFPEYPSMKPYIDQISDLLKVYNTLEYNLTKAYSILEKYGFKRTADGTWLKPDGTPLSIIYLVNAASREEMAVADVIAAQLRRAGISVEVRPMRDPALGEAVLRGEYDLKLNPFCPGDTDPYDNLALFHGKYWRPLGERAPWYEINSFRYRNPEYDAIVDQLAITPPDNTTGVLKLFRAAMEIWLRDLPVIPISLAPALVPVNTYYWKNFPSADNPWIMPVPWWATMNLLINGYPSPKRGGEWVGGIKPAQIFYTTIYITKEVPRFRGVDLQWYGPFKVGDAVRLPEEDANRLLQAGLASLSPPPPRIEIPTITVPQVGGDQGMRELANSIANLANTIQQSLQKFGTDVMGSVTALGQKVEDSNKAINSSIAKSVSQLSDQVTNLSNIVIILAALQVITLALVALALLRYRR